MLRLLGAMAVAALLAGCAQGAGGSGNFSGGFVGVSGGLASTTAGSDNWGRPAP